MYNWCGQPPVSSKTPLLKEIRCLALLAKGAQPERGFPRSRLTGKGKLGCQIAVHVYAFRLSVPAGHYVMPFLNIDQARLRLVHRFGPLFRLFFSDERNATFAEKQADTIAT